MARISFVVFLGLRGIQKVIKLISARKEKNFTLSCFVARSVRSSLETLVVCQNTICEFEISVAEGRGHLPTRPLPEIFCRIFFSAENFIKQLSNLPL